VVAAVEEIEFVEPWLRERSGHKESGWLYLGRALEKGVTLTSWKR